MRVRWALEEAGLPYESRLIGGEDQKSAAYRAMQPFGQVPVFEEDGLVLFESGAILLHIADRSEVLMPRDAASRARTTAWVFAALSSVEPFVQNLVLMDIIYRDHPWVQGARPGALELAQARLGALSDSMQGRDYLEGRFTVADLLMTTVLRIACSTDLIQRFPLLDAYRLRCEARPAFKRALDAHMGDFVEQAA
jgi:glutathione S-transferase